MRAALVALGLAAVAMAACPNSCSGHGRCSETDRCVCDRAESGILGDRPVWGGADCSVRVCPVGVSHDILSSQKQEIVGEIGLIPKTSTTVNPVGLLRVFLTNGLHVPYSFNVDIEIVSYTAVSAGLGNGMFRYKRDVDAVWSAPVNFDTRASQTYSMNTAQTAFQLQAPVKGVKRDTGVFVWFDPSVIVAYAAGPPVVLGRYPLAGDRFYFNITYNGGNDYRGVDDNTAHAVVECSGRGTCGSAGQCECFPGYGGPACERTSCPNACSGHGMCQPLQRFAAMVAETRPNAAKTIGDPNTAGDVKYNLAFDAKKQYSCLCEIGFRGPDCSLQECPSGPDPMGGDGAAEGRDCSGRGICDYTTGTCQCSQGYYGARCEARSTFV